MDQDRLFALLSGCCPEHGVTLEVAAAGGMPSFLYEQGFDPDEAELGEWPEGRWDVVGGVELLCLVGGCAFYAEANRFGEWVF